MNQAFGKLLNLTPFLFLILLGQVLRRSHGFLRFNHLCFLTIALILFIIGWVYPPKITITEKAKNRCLALALSLFSTFLFIEPTLYYPLQKSLLNGLKIYWGLPALLCLGNLFYVIKTNKSFLNQRALLIVFGLPLLLIPFISPDPIIDVFHLQMMGADVLMEGRNPYAETYPDILKGKYGYTPGYVYWPYILVATTKFKLILGDVRFAGIVSILLSTFILSFIGRGDKYKEQYSLTLGLIFLSFPVGWFVTEQAWTEVFLILQFSILYLAMRLKRWWLAGIALGLMAATKQYTIFIIILSLVVIVRQTDLKNGFRTGLIGLGISLLLFLPFFFWGPDVFIKETLSEILKYEIRPDSLSWISYFYKMHGIKIPGFLQGGFYLIVLGLLSGFLLKKKDMTTNDWNKSLVVMFSILFLFGKQAFCNYYYFLSFLLLTCLLPSKAFSEETISR